MTTFHQQIHIFRFHGQAIPDITPFEHRPSDRGYTLLLDPGVGGVPSIFANEISFSDERSLFIFVYIPSLAERDVVARAICMITPSDHASIPPINGQAAISRSNSFSLCE